VAGQQHDRPADSTLTSPLDHHRQQQQQQGLNRHSVGGRQQGSQAGAAAPSAGRKRQRSSHANGYLAANASGPAAAAAAAAAGGGSSWQQQHWQQLSGLLEGAGQVGGHANSLRFSCGGGPEFSTQQGISSKVYGSMDAGFASGSKAEGSLSYGGPDGCCSIDNGMASVANGGGAAAYHYATADQEESQEVQHGGGGGEEGAADSGGSAQRPPDHHQQQHHPPAVHPAVQEQPGCGSTGKPARGSSGRTVSAAAAGGGGGEGGAAAAAAAGGGGGGSLQEGEGSHGSGRSQDGSRVRKRQRRTSCEVASVQQRMASSMQTTEA
jgi:hypothetical protein